MKIHNEEHGAVQRAKEICHPLPVKVFHTFLLYFSNHNQGKCFQPLVALVTFRIVSLILPISSQYQCL